MEGIALGDILGVFRRPERAPNIKKRSKEDLADDLEWARQRRFTDTPNDPMASYMGRDKTHSAMAPVAPQDSSMPRVQVQGRVHDDAMLFFNTFQRLSGKDQAQYLQMIQQVGDAVKSGSLHPSQAEQLMDKIHSKYMARYLNPRLDQTY